MLGLRALAMACLMGGVATMTVGCGSADCESLCQEGQDGSCTSIDGDCGSFCAALDGVEEPSGCAEERESYESCLNDTSDVCDASCDLTESKLSNCVANYCLKNADSSDCQTLVSSF